MWQKVLCLLLGHKVVLKAFTGHTQDGTNGFGEKLTYSMYRFEQHKFCVRCGKPNPHYKELP